MFFSYGTLETTWHCKDCLACRSGNFLFKQLVCNKSILEVGECPAAEVRNGVHVTSTQHVHTNEIDSNVTYCTSLKVYWNIIETNIKKKPWWPGVESWQWAVGPLAEVGKISKYHTKKRGWVRYKTLLKWAGTGLEVLVIQGGGERLRPAGISPSMPHPPPPPLFFRPCCSKNCFSCQLHAHYELVRHRGACAVWLKSKLKHRRKSHGRLKPGVVGSRDYSLTFERGEGGRNVSPRDAVSWALFDHSAPRWNSVAPRTLGF